MKKIITILITVIFVLTLSGCQKNIEITPDIIDVQFENTRWEDDKVVTDIYITNGTDEAQYIDYMEFSLFLPDGVTEFSGAGYDILTTIEAHKFVKLEIEFTTEFINISKTRLEALDITLDQLEMTFWFSE